MAQGSRGQDDEGFREIDKRVLAGHAENAEVRKEIEQRAYAERLPLTLHIIRSKLGVRRRRTGYHWPHD